MKTNLVTVMRASIARRRRTANVLLIAPVLAVLLVACGAKQETAKPAEKEQTASPAAEGEVLRLNAVETALAGIKQEVLELKSAGDTISRYSMSGE